MPQSSLPICLATSCHLFSLHNWVMSLKHVHGTVTLNRFEFDQPSAIKMHFLLPTYMGVSGNWVECIEAWQIQKKGNEAGSVLSIKQVRCLIWLDFPLPTSTISIFSLVTVGMEVVSNYNISWDCGNWTQWNQFHHLHTVHSWEINQRLNPIYQKLM